MKTIRINLPLVGDERQKCEARCSTKIKSEFSCNDEKTRGISIQLLRKDNIEKITHRLSSILNIYLSKRSLRYIQKLFISGLAQVIAFSIENFLSSQGT